MLGFGIWYKTEILRGKQAIVVTLVGIIVGAVGIALSVDPWMLTEQPQQGDFDAQEIVETDIGIYATLLGALMLSAGPLIDNK